MTAYVKSKKDKFKKQVSRNLRPKKSVSFSKKKSAQKSPAKTIIIFVILATILVVVIAGLFVFFSDPERLAKSEIETLAKNYYENVFYENMLNSDNYSGDPTAALEKYVDSGVAEANLRQLILLSEGLASSNAETYCDKEATSVRFYPESPFDQTSYHFEIDYSCDFD